MIVEWTQFFEERRVARIHGGAVVLRRREGKTWTSFDEFDRRVTGGGGEFIDEGIAARDFIEEHPSTDNLLHERFIVSTSARLEEHFSQDGEEWQDRLSCVFDSSHL